MKATEHRCITCGAFAVLEVDQRSRCEQSECSQICERNCKKQHSQFAKAGTWRGLLPAFRTEPLSVPTSTARRKVKDKREQENRTCANRVMSHNCASRVSDVNCFLRS